MTANLVNLKRENAIFSINENPTNITFNRKTYSDNTTTGGKDVVESTYNENIRITQVNKSQIIINSDIGKQIRADGYVLLGDYSSNMECTEEIEDSFTYNSHLYKITSVIKNRQDGEITSIQAIASIIK